jgi:hypothetical protein
MNATSAGHRRVLITGAVLSAVAATGARAQSDSDLAKALVNPFTTLVKVPLELAYDKRIGPVNGGKAHALSIQPVIPITLNQDWTIISRTILTVVSQKDVFPGAGGQSGLGDTLQSFFLSPPKTTAGGTAWGIGPVLLLPTATDDLLGSKKWGLGPTGGVFTDSGPWTVGILANHIWSIEGSGNSGSISSTFLQPALSYTTSQGWSYTVQTEATYDWKGRQWSVPLEASVAKLTRIGSQQVNLEAGVHYWADSPESGPKGWGVSVTVTLLFPK